MLHGLNVHVFSIGIIAKNSVNQPACDTNLTGRRIAQLF